MRSGETEPAFDQSHADLESDLRARDEWFRAKVQEALDDPRPAIPGEKVAEDFARRRAHALDAASTSGAHLPVFQGEGGFVDGISGLSNKQLLGAADMGVSSDS